MEDGVCSQPPTEKQPTHISTVRTLRRGHKKSRRGCFNCKRRKIKCPENLPSCHYCQKVKLNCEYPRACDPPPSPVIRRDITPHLRHLQLQSSPTLFNLTDMRLFHHFLFSGYPRIPIGNDEVWVTEIAVIAHSYDFLVHAMLGVAASHLNMVSNSDLHAEAYHHRVLAIKGLNSALSTPPRTGPDADAILASCYALAEQSLLIGDSVEEYLTMSHGTQIVMAQHWPEKLGTAFQYLDTDCQLEVASSRLHQGLPVIDPELIENAERSLEQVRPLCTTDVQKGVLDKQLRVIYDLKISSFEAYFRNSELCSSLSSSSQPEFGQIINSSDPVMQILLAHYAAIIVLTYPIKACEWKGRDIGVPNRTWVFQLQSIWDNVPGPMKKYLDWPIHATGSIPRGVCCRQVLTIDDENST